MSPSGSFPPILLHVLHQIPEGLCKELKLRVSNEASTNHFKQEKQLNQLHLYLERLIVFLSNFFIFLEYFFNEIIPYTFI